MLQDFFTALPIFGSNPARLQRTIVKLEQQARAHSTYADAGLFKRLGDLCLTTGENKRALDYYGRAIDVYLITHEYARAEALCRKVISAVPSVLRARCTLAFLSMRDGVSPTFERDLRDYVRATLRAGQQELAIVRLRMMRSVTDDEAVQEILDRQLAVLGETNTVYDSMDPQFTSDRRRTVPLQGNQRERWALMLRIAITGPAEQPTQRTA